MRPNMEIGSGKKPACAKVALPQTGNVSSFDVPLELKLLVRIHRSIIANWSFDSN